MVPLRFLLSPYGNITEQRAEQVNQRGACPEACLRRSQKPLVHLCLLRAAARWEFPFIDVGSGRRGRIWPVIAYAGREESGEEEDGDSFGCTTVNIISFGGPGCPGDHTALPVITAVTAERTLPFRRLRLHGLYLGYM